MAYALENMIHDHMSCFQKYGMEEENLRGYYHTWKKNTGNHSVKDYLWFTFNKLLDEVAQTPMSLTSFYEYQLDIHLNMLSFRRRIENKKDHGLVQKIYELRIKHDVESLPFEIDIQVSSGGCCAYCDSLEGKLYTPEDALKNMYLGSSKCTRPRGCFCRTVSVARKGPDGSTIRKKS